MRKRELMDAARAETIAAHLSGVLHEIEQVHAAQAALPASLSVTPAGCATMTDLSERTDTQALFCIIAKPIPWSAHDTDDTILQVKEHNAAGKVLCGW